MKEFIEKLIGRLEELRQTQVEELCEHKDFTSEMQSMRGFNVLQNAIKIVNQLAEEYNNGWISVEDRLPEKNGNDWVSCIVSVMRGHYPTSTYDVCDSPYDETIVMHANYHVSQKIWHLECDEQLNALIDIEDAPLNSDYVIAWQPLPAPYQPKGE